MLDLKITGGTIADGTGSPGYRGDIGIKDGRLVAIGEVSETALQTIDATGRIVAPGFIDLHTHYDAQAFWDPLLTPSSLHGVTTIIGGFCGFSIAPLTKESGAYLMPMLARVEGMPLESLKTGVPWDWSSFAEYLSRLEGKLAINAGFLAGHSAIRRYVMGPRAVGQVATEAELVEMKSLLRQSVKEGALGFSTTLSPTHNDAEGHPVPSRAASREEVLGLFAVISEFEGTVAEMIPGVQFTDETYEILTEVSLAAQRPVNWNAVVLTNGGAAERADIERKLGASDYAKARGATVVALTVPTTPSVRVNFASGMIYDSLPGWAPLFKLPIPERIEKLRDPAYREALKTNAERAPEVFQLLVTWTKTIVAEAFSAANKRYEGRLIGEIAAAEKRDPFEMMISIAIADDLKTSFVADFDAQTTALYRERARLWEDPRVVIGASDAGAHVDGIDTFANPTDLLGEAARKHKVISIENAVHHLTQKPAELMGLKERGVLKMGWHADIVIFDPETIGREKSQMRYDLPAGGARLFAEAIGIHHVIVNGCEILRDGEYLGTPAGVILRPGKDTYTVNIPATADAA